jgi:type I restriction enzyme, S subunit
MSETLPDVLETPPRRFRPYPQYKDSGVEWLGAIPKHWGVKRLKYLATINDEALPEGTAPDLEITYVDISSVDAVSGITATETLPFERAPSRARRIVRDGDVIVSTVRTYLRAIAPIQNPGPNLIVSTGFAVIRPTGLDSSFGAYAFRAPYCVERVVANSVGVSYPAIDAGTMSTFPLAFPDRAEQRDIATFLDRETAKIDALVAKKQRVIDLLQERRAALITQAVTKGLDPTVAMKDSGIEWLGEIPTHWKVKKLKALASLQTGVTLGKHYQTANLEVRPYLRVANVQDGHLDLNDIAEIEIPSQDTRRYELRPGDVLMTEGGDFDKLGRGQVWDGQVPGCLHQNHIFAVRPNRDEIRSEFLATIMGSGYGRAYFTATSKQSTNLASTNSTTLKNFPVPLPEPKDQEYILRVVAIEVGRLDAMSRHIQEGIDRVKEFRAALISAAVTGKIDVREEAA